jgi:hypothetical protein
MVAGQVDANTQACSALGELVKLYLMGCMKLGELSCSAYRCESSSGSGTVEYDALARFLHKTKSAHVVASAHKRVENPVVIRSCTRMLGPAAHALPQGANTPPPDSPPGYSLCCSS